MDEGLNKPLFSQRCLQTLFIFLSHARFARELADVFEKNEKKKNKPRFVYKLSHLMLFHMIPLNETISNYALQRHADLSVYPKFWGH